MSLSTESAAARGSAPALFGFALTLISALVLAPGWARAVPAMHALVPVSAAVSLGAPQGLIFRSGFEEGEDSCASAPDNDDDGLLDARCIEPFVPPDPTVVAPPINPTVVTDFIDANEFIGYGLDPIQRGLQPGLIQRYRAAVLRGRVLDEAGEPLPSVLVRVLDHPEYGYTYSRADGYYDLLVNGGGQKVLDFQRSDRLRAQRSVQTPWRDWALVEDLRLIQLDSLMTPVQLGSAAPAQFAAGSPVQDEDGSRQARVFFPAGTSASMTLPNGQQQPLPVMHFRATEYTVGEGGPERMPGELPPSSGYTYAVELSADQALAAGATRVDFSQPVGLYVDNFIGFPVGEIVPAGWYDFRSGSWVPSDNGRVIKILGTAGSLAQVDIDGSGQPASAEALAELGIGAEERAMLAQTYAAGSELWRTPLDHLTPWDCNWPYVPPDDVEPPSDADLTDDPNSGGPDDDPREGDLEVDDLLEDPEEEPCDEGSVIYCQSMSLGLHVPVPGSGQILSYRSNRTEAALTNVKFALRLPSRSMPASLRRATVDFEILGRKFSREVATELLPDGRRRFVESRIVFDISFQDAYGRTGWQGPRNYVFRLTYHYQNVFASGSQVFASAFARFSARPFPPEVSVGLRRGDLESRLSRVWGPAAIPLSFTAPWNLKQLGFGGWMLSEVRMLDPVTMTVFHGDGGQRRIHPRSPFTEGGILERGPVADNLDRAAHQLTPSGSIVLLLDSTDSAGRAWQELVERMPNGQQRSLARSCVSPDWTLQAVSRKWGSGSSSSSGPTCMPGTQLWMEAQRHAIDERGRVLLLGTFGLYRLSHHGRLEQLAGGETGIDVPCGGFGVTAMASHGDQVFLACGAQLHLIDVGGHALLSGAGTDLGEGVPAADADLGWIASMAFEANGDLLIAANNRIRRVGRDGLVRTVAGTQSTQVKPTHPQHAL